LPATTTTHGPDRFGSGSGLPAPHSATVRPSGSSATASAITARAAAAVISFTAIAPHIADVLPELASVDGLESPRIVGSVTREVIGGVHVERATFRFRRPRRKSK